MWLPPPIQELPTLKVEMSPRTTQQLHIPHGSPRLWSHRPFCGQGFVDRNGITARTLSRPIPVYNVDGTRTRAESIREVVDVILRYKDHSERVQFAVTGLGKQDAILGYTWLKDHNPEVDWITQGGQMSRCPSRCSTAGRRSTGTSPTPNGSFTCVPVRLALCLQWKRYLRTQLSPGRAG